MGCNGWGCSLPPGDLSLNPSLASAWSWAGTLGKSLSCPFSPGVGGTGQRVFCRRTDGPPRAWPVEP